MINTDFLKTVDGMTPFEQCEMLRTIASDVPHGQSIVEIGVHKGRATVYLGAGAAEGGNGVHVYGIDPWDLPGIRTGYQAAQGGRLGKRYSASGIRRAASTAVQRAGVQSFVSLVRAFSVDAAKAWKLGPIGLLVVDGDHSKEAVLADFRAWRPHLADDATVVFDDYREGFAGVVEAVDELDESNEIDGYEVMFGRCAVAKLPEATKTVELPDEGEVVERIEPAPDVELPEIEEPPRSGPGSGAEHWREYAVAVTGRPAENWDGMARWEILEILIRDGHIES